MILNRKTFNEFLKFRHCKLESIEDALDLMTEGCYFGSVDLKDAYYSIPVHENYQKYLKLFWKEAYYQYIVLPNGFSPAVRVFTKVLTTPFKYLRSKKHLSVKHIDDSLLLGETFEICFNNIITTVGLLRDELGFTRWFVIESVKMTTTLTEERRQYIYMFCHNVRSNYQATIRELEQTIGVIVSSFRAVQSKYYPWEF